MPVQVDLRGVQEAQQANLRDISQLSPQGAAGTALRQMTGEAWAYATQITHRWTGILSVSHRMKLLKTRGEVFIDPAARNPISKTPPVEYGVYEHGRGGAHAFYDRTVAEAGEGITSRGLQFVAAAVE